jgi:predicted permease
MDGRVLAVLAGVCLGAVFVFGLVPAVHLAKTDVMDVLKSGGRSGLGGLRSRKWTTAFLAAQFGLSTIFVATVVNAERISRVVRNTEFSIDMSPLLTMWISLPPQKYRTPDERVEFHRRLRERINESAGVLSSAMTTALPSGGAAARQMAIDGRPPVPVAALPTVWTIAVSPRYFGTIGLPIRGRDLTEVDGISGPNAVNVVVNQRLANVYFPHEDPIGRRLQLSSANAQTTTATIVGVSATFRQRANSGAEADPLLYLPLRATAPATSALVVRVNADPDAVMAHLREEVRTLDPDLPIYRMMTMEQSLGELRWGGTQSMWISYALISIAFGLAIVGLYAVTAHAVAQRTQELGVRIALGAQPFQVMSLVLGRMLRQLAVGLAVGVACTFAWERLFTSISTTPDVAATVRMTDPIVLLLTDTSIAVVALTACLSLALRATRLDPVVALRHE